MKIVTKKHTLAKKITTHPLEAAGRESVRQARRATLDALVGDPVDPEVGVLLDAILDLEVLSEVLEQVEGSYDIVLKNITRRLHIVYEEVRDQADTRREEEHARSLESSARRVS